MPKFNSGQERSNYGKVRRARRTTFEVLTALLEAEGFPNAYLKAKNVKQLLIAGRVAELPEELHKAFDRNSILREERDRYVALCAMDARSLQAVRFGIRTVQNAAIRAARLHLQSHREYSAALNELRDISFNASELDLRELEKGRKLAAEQEASALAAKRKLEVALKEMIDARQKIESEILSRRARDGAEVRHAENRQIADMIMSWYSEHHSDFRSMDAAAEAAMNGLPPLR